MKRVLNSLLYTSVLSVLLIFSTGSKAQAQDVTVSYQSFYDELSPYGQWVYDPDYGNVWVPNEDADFRPYYSRGRWVMTDYGNTWVSDDPWGWACYHYGRWTYNPYYGWIWIPGYEWAPAWVSWRWGGSYCGWAPMGPGINVGMSWGCPDSWWVFIGPQYLYRTNYYNYWRGVSYNHTYISQTTIINNVYVDNRTRVQYNFGPRASTVQAVTHAPVQVYRMTSGNRPGQTAIQQNTVSIYRPIVNRNTYTTARPNNVIQAPRNIGRPEAAVVRGNAQPAFRQEIQRMNAGGNTGVVGPRNNTQQPGRGQVQPSRFDNRNPDRFDQRNQPGQPDMRNNGRFDQRNQPAQPDMRNNGRFDQRNEPYRQQQEPIRQDRFDQRNQPDLRNNGRFDQRNEPARQPEPARTDRFEQPQPQQPVRQPEPNRFQQEPVRQQPNRPEPQRFQPEQPRYEPQRQPEQPRYEPQRQPEQPRYNPQPQPQRRPEQPRYEPQRQPEQPRYNPQPQPQRQPEQPRFNPQPQRQPEPPRQAPTPPPAPRQQSQPQQERPGGRR